MSGLGEALAVVAFADQCLKYGKKFVKRCHAYLHAEEEAQELLLAIETNWIKMETQIKILRRIAPSLNKQLQDMQSQVLSQLEGKLKTASLMIDQLTTQPNDEEVGGLKHDERIVVAKLRDIEGLGQKQKMTYAMKQSKLRKAVDDIEKWQARYDPSWILIMQMSIGSIDEQLDEQYTKRPDKHIPIIMAAKGIRDAKFDARVGNQGSVWISPDDIDLNPINIPHSSIHFSQLKYEKRLVLIDTMTCNPSANVNSTTKKVRDLARMLAEVDPLTFSLLKCRGVLKLPKVGSLEPFTDFKFIFDIPSHLTQPQSLRGILLSSKKYPLDQRLELAKKLTSSILFVHTVQFVHKNIRPETIIVFRNECSDIGAPFLAGFEQFRLENGITYKVGDDLWDHNLYRHPSRQGINPEVEYQMQHDIYSLGVVLLEIGLWTSLVVHDADDAHSTAFPHAILNPEKFEDLQVPLGPAVDVKEKLEALAERELPERLGRRYTDIVLLCLRCLDTGSDTNQAGQGFGVDAWTDEDGIVIGVRFIENVLEKMQEINI